MLGRYRLLELVGQGELSIVYRATDTTLNRTVAVKTFSVELEPSSADARRWRAQFQREVEAASTLDHPAIVRIFDAGFEAGRPYVVMEYVEGESLTEACRDHRLSLDRRLDIALVVAEALEAAHAHGITHHHLCPNNVLLAEDGSVKVTDFGLARLGAINAEATPVPGALRTHYRSPEQIYGWKLDERTDLFALGIIIYEMVLLRRPFDGPNWAQVTEKILNADPPFLKESSGELPTLLVATLTKALAKNPLDRQQSARELVEELRAAREQLQGHQQPISDTWPGLKTTEEVMLPESGPCLLIDEDGRRRCLPLGDRAEFRIGRRSENDLVLRHEHVSRSHARIVREGDALVLMDAGSKHGTYLNDAPIERAQLQDGDRITLGKNSEIQIRYLERATEGDHHTTTGFHPVSQERNMELLLDISRALNSSLSVDDVLNLIIDQARTLTGAERGMILLREADGGLRTRISRYLDACELAGVEDISTGLVGRCLATQSPVVIHNVDEVEGLDEHKSISELNLKSILCIPLMYKGEVRGVVYLDSRQLKAPFRSLQLSLLSVFANHASIALENARLYELAIVDALTGVYLRHHFDFRLREEFERARRHGSHLSLLFIDVDHFKQVNDTHGHPMGDAALRSVGQAIKSLARSTDLVARYGGEEFLLLAPETRIDAAAHLGDRIRRTIQDGRHQYQGVSVPLTISVGAACFPASNVKSEHELIDAADKAMLQAKGLGRNRICMAGRQGAWQP